MRSSLLALVLVLGCGVATIAQRGTTPLPAGSPPSTSRATSTWAPARTPDGQFDLEGVWDFSTITPLEPPNGLGDKQTFTDEEARTFETRRESAPEP